MLFIYINYITKKICRKHIFLELSINTKEMYIFSLMWYTIHCCDKAFKEIMEGKFYTGET